MSAVPGAALPGVFPESGSRVRVRIGCGRYVRDFTAGSPWCDEADVWRVRCTGVGVVLLSQLVSEIPEVTDPCVLTAFARLDGGSPEGAV